MNYLTILFVLLLLAVSSCEEERSAPPPFDRFAVGDINYTIYERDFDSIFKPGTQMVFQELAGPVADSFPAPTVSQRIWDFSKAVANGTTDTVVVRPGDASVPGSIVGIEENVSTADFAGAPSLPMKYKQTYYLSKEKEGIFLLGQGVTPHRVRTSPNASHGLVFGAQRQLWSLPMMYYPAFPIQNNSWYEAQRQRNLNFDFSFTSLGGPYQNYPSTLVCSLAYAGTKCLATGVVKLPSYKNALRVLLIERTLIYGMNFKENPFVSLPATLLQLYGIENGKVWFKKWVDVINPGAEGLVARMYYDSRGLLKVFERQK